MCDRHRPARHGPAVPVGMWGCEICGYDANDTWFCQGCGHPREDELSNGDDELVALEEEEP